MWFGELITKRGIGNGISLLIFASILTSMPQGINAWLNGGAVEKLFFPLIAIGIVVAVVFVQEGQRRIPIQYAKRMVGRRQTQGGATYMPLRVNMAGVIPVIFAAALLALPQTVSSFAPSSSTWINTHFSPSSWTYLATEAILIIVFTYFYTAVQFNPVDQADNLRKYGGYIPGIRPGPPTAQYLDRVLTQADAARLAVPRHRRRPAVDLHQALRLLAGDLARARRHLGADRRRRRARHDAPDGVADDDALLRGLPAVNLLVLGPQGAGKGTQAKHIASEYGIPHVSTGDMFRAAQARRHRVRQAGRRDHGLRRARARRADDRDDREATRRARMRRAGFVLDGFPRNLAQAEALDTMLGGIGRGLDAILFFDVTDEVGTQRALERAELEGRADDTRRCDREAARDLPLGDRADRRALPRDRQARASARRSFDRRGLVGDLRFAAPGGRMIIRKSAQEIETMARAGKVVAETLALIEEQLQPGDHHGRAR